MIYLRFCVLWNNRLKKFGPKKMVDVNRHKIRHNLTFAMNIIHSNEGILRRAKKMAASFCLVSLENMRNFYFTR